MSEGSRFMTPSSQPLDFDGIGRRLRRRVSTRPKLTAATGDQRDGSVFVVDRELLLAINIALATNRPLLLRGLPGTGKSSMAAFVAQRLGWRYYEMVMTSETLASDLLWRYDAVRRLADAQIAGARAAVQARTAAGSAQQAGWLELPAWDYIEPGPLWWAQSPATAVRRGAPEDREPTTRATEATADNRRRDPEAAVVLIDEVDKAEPSVPNALLVPLGSQAFVVEPTGRSISLANTDEGNPLRMLVIITTNEERQLPRAFIRRCVVHTMPLPKPPRMVEIAAAHDRAVGRPMSDTDKEMCLAVAKRVEAIQNELIAKASRPPGTAEFLDAWRTVRDLELSPDHPDWDFVEKASLRKEFTDLLEQGL